MMHILGVGGESPVDPVLAFLANPTVTQVSATVVLVGVFVSILRGWLVPRSVMVDRMNDKDAIILALTKDRDNWHSAHTVSEAGRAELKEQNTQLIRAAETQNRFFDKFHEYLDAHLPTQSPRRDEGSENGHH